MRIPDPMCYKQMTYIFRVVLMLSAIEQPQPVKSINSIARLNTDAISMLDLGANDGDSGALPTAQQRLFRRHKRKSVFQKILDLVWRLLLALGLLGRQSPANANGMVTRSLAATIQQLRYYSGSSLFFTRGLVLYLFWYHGAFAVFEFIALIVIMCPFMIGYIFLDIFKIINTDGHEMLGLFFSIAFETLLGVIRGAYFALLSEHIAFHTMQVFRSSRPVPL
jgi:hypothetical protein